MARVLVVDDAAFMVMMISNMLKELGHEVVGTAGNGREAVEEYKRLKPDVVTMDMTMPEVNGIEGVKLIKAFDASAKIVMCSAMGQQSMVLEAITAGALDFVVKPFTKDRVGEALGKLGF